MSSYIKNAFPIQSAPLVHCITNTVTVESVANALYFTGARPVMSEDTRELPALHNVADAVFINLGSLSESKTAILHEAGLLSKKTGKPTVLDLVGFGMSDIRNDMGNFLVDQHPTVVKGNVSELRAFCGLARHGSGVDGSAVDEQDAHMKELLDALKKQTETYPNTVFLATGSRDLIVSKDDAVLINNGTEMLGLFTGTGDMVGAIIAGLLGDGVEPFAACTTGVSYFALCGEDALDKYKSHAQFRAYTMDALSELSKTNWTEHVKVEEI